MMNLQELQQWIVDHIEQVDSPEQFATFFEEIAVNCLEYGGTIQEQKEKEGVPFADEHQCMVFIISTGHCMWKQAMEFCRKQYSLELFRYGFLMMCKCIDTDNEQVDTLMKNAADEVIAIAEKEDNVVRHEPVTPQELTNLVGEYFTLMRDLGTFYRDPDKYDTDEKREKHKRIMEIYGTLIHDD